MYCCSQPLDFYLNMGEYQHSNIIESNFSGMFASFGTPANCRS